MPSRLIPLTLFCRISNPFKNINHTNKRIVHSSYYRFSRSKTDINVVTIHDFIPELFFPIHRKTFNRLLKYICLRKADAVICVSKATKNDLLKFFPKLTTKKVFVIPNGVDESFFCEKTILGKYFLFVGARRKYKNFEQAIKQVSLSHLSQIVVVGEDFNKKEKKIISKYPDVAVVRYSNLNKDNLRKTYNEAYALLHPSIYEGFGLTSIEALLAGCPVIAYGCPAIKEVLKDWDLIYNDFEPINFIRLNNKLNQDYNEYVRLGKKIAKKFSWETSYRNHIRLYEELLKPKL